MFKMIGGDGREYGPATAEELSAWILDHRANAQTMVRAEGGVEWVPLSRVPEFAEVLQNAYPHTSSISTPAETVPEFTGSADSVPGASFSVGDCLGRGWVLLRRHLFLIMGGCGLVWLVLTVTAMATCLGGLLSLVLSGALYGGLTLLYLRAIRGQTTSIATVFSCFGPQFFPLMLIAIVTQVASQVGLLFCLIPGLFLKVIWVFGLPLAADRQLAFWPALESSRRVVLRHFLKVAGLMFVAFLPLLVFEVYGGWRLLNFLLETLGPTGTWTFDAIQAKQQEIGKYMVMLGLEEQFAVLLSMPFGYATLLHAYEDLFGPRSQVTDR